MENRLAEYFVVVGHGSKLRIRTQHGLSYFPEDLSDLEDELKAPPPTQPSPRNPEMTKSTQILQKALKLEEAQEGNPFHGLKFEMEVIDRFPKIDYLDSSFEETALHQFCLPTGLYLTPATEAELPRFYTFIWTMDTGQRLYGSCLRFLEQVEPNVLREFLESDEAKERNLAYDPKKSSKPIMAPKCICIISVHPFCRQFQKFLREMYRNSINPTPQPLPLERWLCNLILETPLPPNGYMSVHYKINGKEIRFARPPVNNPLCETSVSLRTLFELLDLKTIIEIYTAMLLETKICLLSTQESLLAEIAEAFMALMFPFTWHHAYIPLLPEEFHAVIEAPFTYFIGTPTRLFPPLDPKKPILPKSLNLPGDIVVLDLDSNTVFRGENIYVHDLPDHEKKKLFKALTKVSTALFDKERISVPTRSLAVELPVPPDVEAKTEEVAFSAVEVREAFLRVWLSLFRNYATYFEKKGKAGPSAEDYAKFIECLPKGARPFMEQFLETQAWQHFLDSKLRAKKEDRHAVRFFDEKVREKLGRSVFNRKKPTPFLQTHAYAIQHKFEVPPPKSDDLLQSEQTFTYGTGWPQLNPKLFYDPRISDNNKLRDPAPSIATTTTVDSTKRRELLCDTKHLTERIIYYVWFTVFLNALNPADERGPNLRLLFKTIVQMINEGINPSLKLFTQIVETLGKLAWAKESLSVIKFMDLVGVSPDATFYATVLNLLSGFYGDATRAYQILGNLGKIRNDPSILRPDWKLLPVGKRRRPYETISELTMRFQRQYPGLSMDTRDQCAQCNENLHDLHIRLGWSTDSTDQQTKCPQCGKLFLPKWKLRKQFYSVSFKTKPLGIGLIEGRYKNEVFVDKLLTPFSKDNLKIGDQLCEVDGQSLLKSKLTFQHVTGLLKKVSVPCTLKFQRVSWGTYISPACIKAQVAAIISTHGVNFMLTDKFKSEAQLYWSIAWEFSSLNLPPLEMLRKKLALHQFSATPQRHSISRTPFNVERSSISLASAQTTVRYNHTPTPSGELSARGPSNNTIRGSAID